MITKVKQFLTEGTIKELFAGSTHVKCFNIDTKHLNMLTLQELICNKQILESFIHDYESGWISYYKDSKNIHIDSSKLGPSKYIKS